MDGDSGRDERVALIGRERDLALVEQRLVTSRLVTLTGLGGMGKTSLASEIAARSRAAGNATHVVDLASVTSPADVPAAIAAVIGAEDDAQGDLATAIASSLAAAPGLLLLDNFEHVLDAASVVSTVIDRAPAGRVLVTSRVALGLDGEDVVELRPLGLPAAGRDVTQSSAGALFLERAVMHGRRRIDTHDLDAVVEICRRLDGVPLAIELAAAWTGILTPRAIVRRLLEERLDLSGADARHASIDAVVESTLGLLDARDRDRFAALGAFVGSFDEAAAEAVLGVDGVLPTLRALTAAALVRASADADGEPRFELLETIRAAALRRLERAGTRDEVFRRHVQLYADRAVAGADAVRSSSFSDPRAGAVLADPNLAVAFDRSVEAGDTESAARVANGLSTRAVQTGLLRDAMARLERIADAATLSPWGGASVLNAIVSIRGNLRVPGDQAGDAARAVELARASGDQALLVRTLITLGNWRRTGRADPYAEAAELAERIGYGWGAETAWLSLGDVHWEADRADDALAALDRGLAVAERIGDDAGRANALATRGEFRLNVGRLAEGLADLRAAIALGRRHPGIPFFVTIGLTAGAMAEALAGDRSAAYRNLAEAAERVPGSEFPLDELSWLEAAVVVLAADHPAAAARGLGAFDGAIDLDVETPISRRLHARTARDLEHRLGRGRLARERAAGRTAGSTTTLPTLMRIVRREAGFARSIVAPHGTLTTREQEILAHLADGRTDREIAAALAITPKTASVHVANLKAKLGVETRVEAVLFARDELGSSGQGSRRGNPPSV